ncbi:MAG TPA: hypothetical protein VG498_03490 [Terriglobales bacterium]|nr:hypothetical protein [Terriglobales bacterium]
MRQRISFLTAVIFVASFSANATAQRHGRVDFVQNYGQAIPDSRAVAHKKSAPRPNWDMKYKSGSFKLQEGQWLKGAFASAETSHPATPSTPISVDELRETYKDITPIVAITPDQLRAAYFDSRAEKDSKIVQRMTRSGCHYAESLMPKDQAAAAPQLFVAWLFTPGRISRAVEHLSGRHLVQLVWTDNGAQNEIIFTVNHCEYASFLANLRWFAGQRWQEIGHRFNQ